MSLSSLPPLGLGREARLAAFLIGGLWGALCAPSAAQGRLVEVALEVGIDHVHLDPRLSGGGVALFDVENDGDLDVYLTGGMASDALYLNDGTGQFEPTLIGQGVTGGIFTVGVVTADVDGDGDRDVFLTTAPGEGNRLLRNDGGEFVDVSIEAGVRQLGNYSSGAAFGDVDLDGDLDLFVTQYIIRPAFLFDSDGAVVGYAHECLADVLYLNDGTGRFTESTAEFGIDSPGCGLVGTFSDYDGDSDPDLFVANDFGAWIEPNVLYRNPGLGGRPFDDVSEESGADLGVFAMSVIPGDYDRDGDLDYYVSDNGSNVLLQNEQGRFEDVASAAGVTSRTVEASGLLATSWGGAFADLDHDGHLDLLVANGYVPFAAFAANDTSQPDRFFRSQGDGTFADASAEVGFEDPRQARGLAVGDLDGDGDLDVVVAVVESAGTPAQGPTPRALVYRNDLAAGHWLQVELRGTRSNADGIGARVEAFAGGTRWVHEVRAGESYLSQHEGRAHVGLGEVAVLDSVVVTWPGGHRDAVSDVAADQVLRVIESDRPVASEPPAAGRLHVRRAGPNPTRRSVEVAYHAPAPVTLETFDALGRRAGTLLAGPAGDGVLRTGAGLAPGVYVFVLRSAGDVARGTFTVVRK
jgi:hypothetical protein